jgi:putative effector of murein hydrolase
MKAGLTLLLIAATAGAYVLSRAVAQRFPSPFTTPVFFSTTLVIVLLALGGISLADYEPAKDVMIFLLGPATVGLAVPLYKNRRVLYEHALPALCALVVGSLSTLIAVVLFGRFAQLSQIVCASLSIKSVTAPIAIELAALVQASPPLTAAFVIATGMIGAMFGPFLMDRTGIADPLARGLALGAISHGQGTAQAIIEGELQGAAAGIAMGVAAVFVSCVAPALVPRLL